MPPSLLELTRAEIVAFRRRAGALDERLPPGARSLRQAAWAGLTDSVPRAALLSIHARVEGTRPAGWEDPSLVQVWGPRYSVYVVSARDRAIFTLGRLPADARRRRRAEDMAARVDALLAGRRLNDNDAQKALGVGNAIKYAAPTGTVLIRWEGARSPTIWTVPQPEIDPLDARGELARRYLHIFGPGTPRAFATWAGITETEARATFDALSSVAHRGANADRRRLDPRPRRAEPPRAVGAARRRAPPPERRHVLPPLGCRPRAARSRRRAPRRALDLARLAGRRPRRRRDRRDVAASAGGSDDPVLAPALARSGTRSRRRRSRCRYRVSSGEIAVRWDG